MAESAAPSLATSFWEGVGNNIRGAFNDAIPEPDQTLAKGLTTSDSEVKTIEEKYALIRQLAETELEARKGSTEQDGARKQRHLIAMLDFDKVETWHRLLQHNHPSRPNLSALFNLAFSFLEEGRYLECEGLTRALIPLLESKIRIDAPQVLGAVRMLALCVSKQGRKEEASDILDVARSALSRLYIIQKVLTHFNRNLILRLADQALKDDEMNEVNRVSKEIDEA